MYKSAAGSISAGAIAGRGGTIAVGGARAGGVDVEADTRLSVLAVVTATIDKHSVYPMNIRHEL